MVWSYHVSNSWTRTVFLAFWPRHVIRRRRRRFISNRYEDGPTNELACHTMLWQCHNPTTSLLPCGLSSPSTALPVSTPLKDGRPLNRTRSRPLLASAIHPIRTFFTDLPPSLTFFDTREDRAERAVDFTTNTHDQVTWPHQNYLDEKLFSWRYSPNTFNSQ